MTQKDKLPDILSVDGYPTDEWLEFIKQYRPDESMPIMDFVETLRDTWEYRESHFKLDEPVGDKRNLVLITGGWSGNEDIVSAVLSNLWLKEIYMKYMMWQRGGAYYFEVKL